MLAGSFATLTTVITPPGRANAASLDEFYGQNMEMRTFPAGKGILKTYKDAFTGQNMGEAEYFMGLDGRVKVAYAVIGVANQFQIADAATGKNEFVGTPPSKNNGAISTIGWNKKDGHIYSVMSGTVSQFNLSTKTFKNLGQVTTAATTGYGPAFDDAGNGWYGSYPDAGVGKFTPSTGTRTPYPKVDTGSQYVRTITVLNNTVYCGTGTASPKIISFPVSNPSTKKVITVPDIASTGFVFKVDAHAGRLFVHYEDANQISKCSIYNPSTGIWITPKYKPAGRATASFPGDPWVYYVAKTYPEARNSVVRWNAQTNVYETLVPAPVSPASIYLRKTAAGNVMDLLGDDSTAEKTRSWTVSLTDGKILTSTIINAVPAPYRIESFIASTDGKLYVGGYQGDGISTIDMATNVRWRSGKGFPINQIEGMIEYGNDRIYVGSYGSADLVKFTKADKSAKLIERLRTNYMQSRPFGWALAGGKVICGTVPEYGLRGGALVVIDPTTDTVERVLNKYIPEQSIIGLTGSGDIVYGTTSVKGGYGTTDDTSPATVFAYNVRTNTRLWTNTSLAKEREINSPVIAKGRLFVGVANGIIELDINKGTTLRTWKLFSRVDTPGYHNVRLGYHAQTNRLIHSAGGTLTAIGLANDSRSVLYQGTPGLMNITAAGKIYAVTGYGRDISEIDSVYSPSIASAADAVAISPAGGIEVRRSNGAGGYGNPFTILTSGYSDAKSVHIADWNNNGIFDLVSNHTDGSLRVRYGLPQGGFEPSVTISTSGWANQRITVGRWNYAYSRPAIISVDTAGTMNMWQVSTSLGLYAPKKLGTGWKIQQFAIMDKNYNDTPGLLVKDGAGLFWYPNTAIMNPSSARETLASSGFSGSTKFTVVQKHRYGYNGVLWHDSTGTLRYMSNVAGKMSGILSYGITWVNYRLGGASL